jgi:hypothetical protein
MDRPTLPTPPAAGRAPPRAVSAAGSLRQSILDEIAACIARHGERLDVQVCVDVAAPLGLVRALGAELAAAGAFEADRVAHVRRGRLDAVDTWRWRTHGFVPPELPAAPTVLAVAPKRRRVRAAVVVAS